MLSGSVQVPIVHQVNSWLWFIYVYMYVAVAGELSFPTLCLSYFPTALLWSAPHGPHCTHLFLGMCSHAQSQVKVPANTVHVFPYMRSCERTENKFVVQ